MKKLMIVLATLMFTLTLGLAFADENTPRFSDNNNIGVLLYNEAHGIRMEVPTYKLNWASAEPTVSQENVNIGILLYEKAHPKERTAMGVPETEGAGAGGVRPEKAKETWRFFDEIYSGATSRD